MTNILLFFILLQAVPGGAYDDEPGLPLYSVHLSHPGKETRRIKKACLRATLRAIDLEIARNRKWLELTENELSGNDRKKEIERRLQQLMEEKKKFQRISLREYRLPGEVEVTGRIEGDTGENSMIYTDGMSRSGPFYHITGIRNGDYSVLQPGVEYHFILYPVYRREYPFPDYYVYIDTWERVSRQHRVSGLPEKP